jgi:hypothetical protein
MGHSRVILANSKLKITAGIVILVALLTAPAPLLPPHRLAEGVQLLAGIGWKAAYLLAAVGLQIAFYGAIGALAGLTMEPARTRGGRLLQMVIVPMAVIVLALTIRVFKAGYLPIWINAAIPVISCYVGVILCVGFLNRRGKVVLAVVTVLIGATLWGLTSSASAALSRATRARLQRIVAAGATLPTGDERFGALLRTAFASAPGEITGTSAVQQNRAAILAWGIAVGHPRLARFVGLDPEFQLVRNAASVGQATTLRGREDWPKHYAVSAALAVLEHPLVSDAGGLVKEQLDTLARGSGFSFGDLTADRAGVRFATASTESEPAAINMKSRILSGFAVDDFFPRIVDFPENLPLEQFRRDFGAVGSARYRQELSRIESRLNSCAAIALH